MCCYEEWFGLQVSWVMKNVWALGPTFQQVFMLWSLAPSIDNRVEKGVVKLPVGKENSIYCLTDTIKITNNLRLYIMSVFTYTQKIFQMHCFG